MNKIKDCTVIYNPVASGFKKENLEKIKKELNKNNINIETKESKYKGHIPKLINESDDENKLILTVGGDGTVSEAYKAYNDINQKGLYAHIPTGTTNDMAKNYDVINNSAELILRDILNGEIKEFDTFTVNDKIAAYTSVFGYLAHVPFITSNKSKKNLGYLAYLITGFKELLKKPIKYNISYTTDNIKGTDDFILGSVSNSKGFAGINLFDDVDLNDDKLELLLLKDLSYPLIFSIMKDFLNNNLNLKNYEKHIILDSSNNIELSFNNNYPNYSVDIDGEDSLIKPNYIDKDIIYTTGKKIKVLKNKVL